MANHVKVRSQALENLKLEVAEELGIDLRGYGGDLTARECGRVGGNVVSRLVRMAEEQLSQKNQGR